MSVTTSLQPLRSEAGRGNPYPFYAELHAQGPICAVAQNTGERYQFVVHGYDAVNQVLRDPSFLVTDGEMLERNGLKWREHPSLTALLTSMFFSNEPEHTRLRNMYSRVVTQRRVSALKEPIAGIVDRLLAQLAERGADGATVDFMTVFGYPMPGDVISELMGVPDENRAWFIPRAHIFADIHDLGTSSSSLLQTADAATRELTSFFGDLIKQRQADPRDDMISSFAQFQLTDERVPETELLAGLLTFFNAGFASTSFLLSNGLQLLLRDPALVEAIQADENVAIGFVDEVLRFAPPVHLAVRVASEDREVAGTTVAAGSYLLVLLGAANYDPNHYPEPNQFDPYRRDNRPLTFGAGPHFCLGAALTRLEGQVAFPMIFDRLPKIAAAGEPTRTNRLTLSGFKTFPVTVV